MKKIFKRAFAIILATVMCLSVCQWAFAASNNASSGTAALYSTYGSKMLFQQNESVIIAGTGTPGAQITCKLLRGSDEIASAGAAVKADGAFAVTLSAQQGSYDKYTIESYENGVKFSELSDVLFGELWLSSGQSNMQLGLAQSETGIEMVKEGKTGSEWTRFLATPVFPVYEGSADNIPLDPQRDIPGAYWHDGTASDVYAMSAVAYFFAQKLQEQINVPIGIISVSIGGSSIYPWISRSAIDDDAKVKSDLVSMGRYIETKDWNTGERSAFIDMSADYNKKIAPLANFRPAGMIWYQGEADIFNPYGAYSSAFSLMQSSYTELFSRSADNPLPIVFTQLASYGYGELSALQGFNTELSEIQQASPDTRALTSIYDVPLTYFADTHAIHPICKKPVGEKMCFAAQGLVYDSGNDYTTATVEKCERDGNRLLITLRDVGDGLASDGSILRGFAVCAADGVYVQADAQIIDKDTISVSCESITEPIAATYAYSLTNCLSNLYATLNGAFTLGVSPFVTSKLENAHYYQDSVWMTCDYDRAWHVHQNELTGYYDTWQGDNNTEISFDGGAMCAKAELSTLKKSFSIRPVLRYNLNSVRTKLFTDVDSDFSDYDTLSFSVKNNGENDVSLDAAKIYVSKTKWYAPAVNDTELTDFIIPADGEWHRVTLKLDVLYPYGIEYMPDYSRAELDNIYDLSFSFKASGNSADIMLDSFAFTGNGSEGAPCDHLANTQNAKNIFEKAFCGFINFIGFFINLF